MPGTPAVATDRVLTIPNLISFARLLGVPLFLYLLLGRRTPTWPRWSCSRSAAPPTGSTGTWPGGSARSAALGELLDPLADRLYILATLRRVHRPRRRAVAVHRRAAGPRGCDAGLPRRARGATAYGPPPVHYLGKTATFILLAALPGAAAGARRADGTAPLARSRSAGPWPGGAWSCTGSPASSTSCRSPRSSALPGVRHDAPQGRDARADRSRRRTRTGQQRRVQSPTSSPSCSATRSTPATPTRPRARRERGPLPAGGAGVPRRGCHRASRCCRSASCSRSPTGRPSPTSRGRSQARAGLVAEIRAAPGAADDLQAGADDLRDEVARLRDAGARPTRDAARLRDLEAATGLRRVTGDGVVVTVGDAPTGRRGHRQRQARPRPGPRPGPAASPTRCGRSAPRRSRSTASG